MKIDISKELQHDLRTFCGKNDISEDVVIENLIKAFLRNQDNQPEMIECDCGAKYSEKFEKCPKCEQKT